MDLTRVVHGLDQELCERIIKEQFDYTRAHVIGQEKTKVSDWRTNSLSYLKGELETEVHQHINESLDRWVTTIVAEYGNDIAKCLILPGWTVNMSSYREAIQVLRYEAGQEYKWHTDSHPSPYQSDDNSRTRVISVVVYLNDDFTGGETQTLSGKVKPQQGKALVFPSNWCYPHRACPVTEGTKYALVTWYHVDFTPQDS